MGKMQGRQQSAHKMIARWGGVGQIVRGSTPRNATMARIEYTPRERQGLQVDAECKIRISLVGLTVPPDHEQDYITFRGKTYKILLPPTGPSADGETFAFYDCSVVGTSLG